MTLTSKDKRLNRRYNPVWRQLMSIFMVIIVFPVLTGLDAVAYDAVNEINAKRAQEQYTHAQLCEIAPQYLQGNLIPRLRTLAQNVKDSKWEARGLDGSLPLVGSGGDNNLKSQTKKLSDDLKRIKLALLDNFSKHESNEPNGGDAAPSDDPNPNANNSQPSNLNSSTPLHELKKEVPPGHENNHKSKIINLNNLNASAPPREKNSKSKTKTHLRGLKSKIITTVNHLTTHCKDLASSNKDKRNQAAAKILKLTDPQNQAPPFKLPTTPPKKAHSDAPQLNSLPPNHLPQFANFLHHRDAETLRKELKKEVLCPLGKENTKNLRASASLRDIKKEAPQGHKNHSKSKIINQKNLCASAPLRELKNNKAPQGHHKNHKSKIKDPGTLLDLSGVPHPPVQLAAATDVLTTLLPETTNPDSTGAPTAADIAITPPQIVANDAIARLADDLKTPAKIVNIQ